MTDTIVSGKGLAIQGKFAVNGKKAIMTTVALRPIFARIQQSSILVSA